MRAGEALCVVAEGVDRGIVDTGLDAVFFHIVLEGGAVVSCGEEDGGDVGGGDAGVTVEGDGEFGGEVGAIVGDDFTTALVVGGEFFELLYSQCGADFVDAVVVPQVNDVVGVGVPGVAIIRQGGHAVRAQQFEPGSDLIRMGGEHAALSGSQVFVGEEGEAADITPGAEGFALQCRTRTMRCIFDDVQVVLPGNLEDGRHVAGIAGVVHDDDGFGARGDVSADGLRGDGEVVGAGDVGEDHVGAGDVGEDHAGAGVQDGVGGGDEAQRGDDDFISRPDAESNASQVQRFGGVGDGEAVWGGGHL